MIIIPSSIWEVMLDEFARVRRRVERVCYFDGIEFEKVGVVTTVTIPQAQLARDHFWVDPDEMSEAGKHLRRERMVRLAQVHTHGNDWVGHSFVDDDHAYSQRTGALSIVLPFHATQRPALSDAGVHRREENGWHQLGADEIAQHVRIVPSRLNFRKA